MLTALEREMDQAETARLAREQQARDQNAQELALEDARVGFRRCALSVMVSATSAVLRQERTQAERETLIQSCRPRSWDWSWARRRRAERGGAAAARGPAANLDTDELPAQQSRTDQAAARVDSLRERYARSKPG